MRRHDVQAPRRELMTPDEDSASPSASSARREVIGRAFRAAVPYTLPIFASFWFIGLTYGIYMHTLGFSFWYPMFMSLFIFAGSMEFVAGNMLIEAFDPIQALLMTLMINARHLFYGISMLDRYRGMGWKKFYLIFGLCDENFSLNYSLDVPEGVDPGWFMFFITFLDHMYWFTGATIGGLCGPIIPFDTTGLGFVMTAMFVVIFLDQWLKEKSHASAVVGLGTSLLCLLCFGADGFIIPSMAAILIVLTAMRRPLERSGRLSGLSDGPGMEEELDTGGGRTRESTSTAPSKREGRRS
jgi:4-azaleucine resistance transporter AzlC